MANRLVNRCIRCRRLRKKTVDVQMAPLKPEQVSRSQVFQTVAVDLCGPYQTVAKRRSTRSRPVSPVGKVWVLVIVCAASRAVHLEMCEGYDTAQFLVAFSSFTDLRGVLTKVIADQGSQIVGARNTLEYLWSSVDSVNVRKHTLGVTSWEFVPSGAHNFIGMSERLVKSVKCTMEAINYSHDPRFTKTALSRLLYSIANIVNSRPLAINANRASKFEESRLLRPNDLLLGRSRSEITPLVPINLDFDELTPSTKASKIFL